MANPLRVALADDDDGLRELVAELLQQVGHEVTAVADGAELLRACRRTRPDVVVSDVRMPPPDGLAAADLLRRELGVPVVLMSGSWTGHELTRAKAAGASTLHKPFHPLDLLAAVGRATTPRRLNRRVLVAEDAPGGLPDLLTAAGYDVAVCPVDEALATADTVRPQLLFVDATRRGWETVRRVRSREWGKGVCILAVGEWEADEADAFERKAEANASGCDGCLIRPVGEDEVAYLVSCGR